MSFYDLTKAGRTQIEFELVKDAHYRIYLAMENKLKLEELLERVVNKCHHFTPYLGLAQFTTQVDFVQKTTAQKVKGNGDYAEIITAVNMSKLQGELPVEFEKELFYSANNMPIAMNREREVLEYSEVLIEKNGNPLKVKVADYYSINGVGNILFL
jgi:CRISPR-associated protein Cas5h